MPLKDGIEATKEIKELKNTIAKLKSE